MTTDLPAVVDASTLPPDCETTDVVVIEELGFEFERSYFPGKAVIQPNTEGLMFTGNEKVFPYRDQAVPAPRGHKVPVPGDTGGAAMVLDLLAKRVEEAGVEVRYET